MDSLWLTQNAAYFEGKKGQAPNPKPLQTKQPSEIMEIKKNNKT